MYLPVNFRTMNPDVVLSYRCASWVGWRIVWQQEGCTQQASMLISAMFCIMSQVCRFGNNYHTSRNHTWAIYIFLVERLVLHNLLHDPDCKIMTSSFFCGSSGLLCKCIILLYIQVTAFKSIVLHGPKGLDKFVLFTLHLWNSFDLFDCNISHTFIAKSFHIKLKTNQKKKEVILIQMPNCFFFFAFLTISNWWHDVFSSPDKYGLNCTLLWIF